MYVVNGANGTAVLTEKHDFVVPQTPTKPSSDNSDVSEPADDDDNQPEGGQNAGGES